MFLTKKTLLTAFTVIAVTGCVTTTNDTEQLAKITNLESSLVASKTLTTQTKNELDSANMALKISEEKIIKLSMALEKSQKMAKTTKAIKNPKVTHIDDKTILGQSEWVYVSTVKENFKGRIDTGAATSSLNAVDIERFERDGEKWVRFNLTHAKGNKAEMIEAKIVRIAKITQSSKPGVETERPVVKLHVRIGDVAHLTEFTLTSRLHMEYPVLIGRTFMQDVVLVDVSKEYIFEKHQAPKKQ
ncbi:ATP-dependent zinc protease family protein [Psychromonas hadalis]|uniref:ATP-dependent zinc protease family protein n=1 Tax=Psychromonas hadalis TaxID=211669 RepID=UPI0003B7298F|nr:ATP-dependent zinc protease [Psychromonas hadalis]